MPIYRTYGVTFQSDLRFQSPLLPSTQPPTLTITQGSEPVPLGGSEFLSRVPDELWNAAAPQTLHRLGARDVLDFGWGDQIVIEPETIHYVQGPSTAGRVDLLDARLLGTAFAWWMLRAGRLPFHAGALAIEGQAVLFSAESGMGKSSLMCSLVAQGVPLLSDDFVSASLGPDGTVRAASAYPQMRLWPNTVARFLGDPNAYPAVFQGGNKRRVELERWGGPFLEGTFPVSRILLLQRHPEEEGTVTLERLHGHHAFMQILTLLTMSTMFPLDDFQHVWPVVQRIAADVPVYHLAYPSGWQWLPQLHEAILRP